MVVTDLPSTMDIRVAQARVACPSVCPVQAPHDAMPQPNFVPVSLRCSRRTQSSGVLGSTPSSLRTPLTVKATMRFLHLSVKTIFQIRNDVFGTARRRLNMVPDCRRMVADFAPGPRGGRAAAPAPRAPRCRATKKRDELATSQLIEWHSISVPRREEQKAEA